MPELRPKILVIEDEPPLKKFLRITLQSQNYIVIEATCGEEGIRQAAMSRPDLIILDLGLPDIDGVEVARRLARMVRRSPIVVVSAAAARSRTRSSRSSTRAPTITLPSRSAWASCSSQVYKCCVPSGRRQPGDCRSGLRNWVAARRYPSRREVSTAGQVVHLTPNEFKLLSMLVKNAGKVLTHRQLLHEVWGPGSGNETHYVRVYMNQLRQKLEADATRPKYLITEPGVGYRLKGEE